MASIEGSMFWTPVVKVPAGNFNVGSWHLHHPLADPTIKTVRFYRGTSLKRKCPPPRTAVRPWA